jgi:putative membrane protein
MFGIQLGVPLAGCVVAGLLYASGMRRGLRPVGGPGPAARRMRRRRAVLFALALATIVLALASPVDDYADRLFWVHMGQHILLVMVAAPLLVLSAPWMVLWRPFPLAARRWVARASVSGRGMAPARLLLRPLPAWIAFNVVMWAWHAPALYDLTLRNQAVHDLEHATFLVTGVLLWAQLVDSPPLHARLDELGRGALALTTILSSWFLALALAFWPSPLYSHYAELAHRPGGISALTDQQLAAGMMWVPGSLPLSFAIFVLIYNFVGRDDRAVRHRPARVLARPQEKGV